MLAGNLRVTPGFDSARVSHHDVAAAMPLSLLVVMVGAALNKIG